MFLLSASRLEDMSASSFYAFCYNFRRGCVGRCLRPRSLKRERPHTIVGLSAGAAKQSIRVAEYRKTECSDRRSHLEEGAPTPGAVRR